MQDTLAYRILFGGLAILVGLLEIVFYKQIYKLLAALPKPLSAWSGERTRARMMMARVFSLIVGIAYILGGLVYILKLYVYILPLHF